MAEQKPYSIVINLEGEDAVNALAKIATEAKKTNQDTKAALDEMTKKFNDLEKNGSTSGKNFALNMASAMIAVQTALNATSGAMTLLKTSIAEAAKEETAMNRLNNVLKLTGSYSAQTSKSFNEYAEAIERTSMFEKEEVLNQLSMAKQMGYTNSEAQKLVTAARNMAQSLGIDLGTAMNNLLGSLTGVSGRIAKLSPELKAMTAEQLKAGSMVKYFGDMAIDSSAAMDTYDGQIHILSLGFDAVTGAIGDALLANGEYKNVIQMTVTVLDDFAGLIKENADGIQTAAYITVGAIASLSAVLTAFAIKATIASGGLNLILASAAALITGGTLGVIAKNFVDSADKAQTYISAIDELAEAQEKLIDLKKQAEDLSYDENDDPEIRKTETHIYLLEKQIALYRKVAETDSFPTMLAYQGKQLDQLESHIDAVMTKMTGNMNAGQTVYQNNTKPVEADNKIKATPNNTQAKINNSISEYANQLNEDSVYQTQILEQDATFQQARLDLLNNAQLTKEEMDEQLRNLDASEKEAELNREYEHQEALLKLQLEKETKAAQLLGPADEQKLAMIEASNNYELNSRKNENKLRLDSAKATAKFELETGKQEKKQKEMTEDQKLAVTQNALSQGASLMASSNAKLFEIGKASAIANATISMFTGASKALEMGFPLGPIMAGLIITAGLANINQIRQTKRPDSGGPKFANGGIFNSGGSSITGDSNTAQLNDQEMVWNIQQQKNLMAIANGSVGGGMATDILLDIRNSLANQSYTFNMDGQAMNNRLHEIDARRLA